MVRIDYRRTLSRLLNAVSGLLAPRGRNRFAFAAARKRQERGQTLVEFAFALPLLLLIVLLFVDFGLALDRRQMLQHSVREGAREGAVGASPLEIQTTTAERLGLTDISQITVCYTDTDGDAQFGEVGEDVRVGADVVYRFATGTDLVSLFGVSPEIRMTPSAEMRLERSPLDRPPCGS
jgi:Flp pilus assembly protein TadG